MKILVALLASLTVAPAAEALTWKEFWEPFVEYGNHYHHEVHYFEGIITITVLITDLIEAVGKKNFSKKRYGYQATGMMGIG